MFRTLLTLLLIASLPATAGAGVPRLSAEDAPRAAAAEGDLRSALSRLRTDPGDRAARAAAEDALQRVERAFESYFHARNLRAPAARAHALALRPVIHGLFAGSDALLVLHGDVLELRPDHRRILARAAERQRDPAARIRHLRAAAAVEGPTLTDLASIKAAHVELGDARAAAAVDAEIALLRTAALPTAQPTR
jgi:hypothetical protein